MNPLTVEFGCKSPATNQQVIDRLNELETIIYASNYTVINQTSSTYTVIQKLGRIVILCDTTLGAITIKLSKAYKNNIIIDVKKISSDTNTVTIKPYGSETLDDGTEAVIMVQNVSVELASDGNTNWKVI